MGRRERPLDPAEGPVARFACELRKLRQEAGSITYRAMAGKAHYSTATLAQAAAGDRLPSLAVTLAYVAACCGNREEWERRWHEADRETAEGARSAEEAAKPPYLGLARFDADDYECFFGRDRLVDQLVELVGSKYVTVVAGPSGSGKSSLLRAGLIHRLRQAEPRQARPAAIRILTPGPHPARTHAGILDPRATRAGTVMVVDQFEEVFTLCTDRAERARFLDLLCTAARPDHGIRIVVAVRADFYGHLAQHRSLAEAARDATLLVAPMSPEEVREAIVKPAALGGLVVERTLTARIIREIADEPGGLPLMSHALLETWRWNKGRVLTEAAYDAVGGIHGAIAHTAEEVYGRLTPDQAEAARRIMLRLVTPGQGNQDTRRPADRIEVTALGPSPAADAELVLERLAHARLVTLDNDTVDLAHEAVLAAWPRLRAWIDEERDWLRIQRHLTEATHTWQALGRDPGSLYRGLRLSLAEQHRAALGRGDDLTPLERQFLTASLAARDRDRRGRRTRTTALSVLLGLSLIASLVAWQQHRAGERRHIDAEARRVVGVADSLRLSDPQTAMRLSLAAWHIADLPETRSALLATAAQKEQDVFTDPDGDTRNMRRLSADGTTLISIGAEQVTRWDIATHRRTAVLPGLGRAMENAGFPRTDAQWLPIFEDSKIALHDLATGRLNGPPLTDADGGTEMSPSGRTLIVYDSDGGHRRIQLWDPRTRRKLLEVEQKPAPHSIDPSGLPWPHLMALMGELERERRTLIQGDATYPDATVSADDRYLALCIPGEQLQLWDVAKGRRMGAPWLPKVSVRQCVQEQVKFSGDGSRLTLVDDTGFRTWQIDTGRELPAAKYAGLKVAELSKDGAFMAASDGEEILVWRLATPLFPVFRHRLSGETVKDIKIDTGTGTLRYLGGPGNSWGPTVHTLSLGRSVAPDWTKVQNLASTFSSDGATLATAKPDTDGEHIRFRLLDGHTGKPLAEPRRVPCPISDGDPLANCAVLMDFDSTGKVFAYGAASYGPGAGPGSIALYDIPRRHIKTVLDVDELGQGTPANISFGPDDRSLLLAGVPSPDTATTQVWDLRRRTVTRSVPDTAGKAVIHPEGDLVVTTRGRPYRLPYGIRLPSTRAPGTTSALAFSPNGAYLAAGDTSGRVVLWDGRLTRRLGVLAAPETTTYQYVSALAFSPDGRTLAVAGDAGTLQLWDTTSHQRIGSPLLTPGDTAHALTFSTDGDRLYAAGDHTPLQTYDIAPDRAARVVCSRVIGGLSPSEWRRHLPDLPYRESCL